MPKRERSDTAAVSPNKKSKPDTVAQEITDPEVLKHRLPFKDGECFYLPSFAPHDKLKDWHDRLLGLETWFQPTLKMYGREFLQSRRIASYAQDGMTLKYSGANIEQQREYPDILLEIQAFVEEKLGVKFNHCMLNHYKDGSVHIGKHRDNKENRIIASISLGAERDFIMQHDQYAKGHDVDSDGLTRRKRWALKNGSLLIMQGETQQHWKHEIPKQLKIKNSRISLTFRQYY